MFISQRTNSDNTDFQNLVSALDHYLAGVNGDTNDFFVQYNKIDAIRHVVVVYVENHAVACGAFKEYEPKVAEIKRMYVKPEFRGKGLGKQILNELTKWAKECDYDKCILETAKSMTDAVFLYKNYGFTMIPNYGQYIGNNTSVCFELIV
jgi:putative acetyltransferase